MKSRDRAVYSSEQTDEYRRKVLNVKMMNEN